MDDSSLTREQLLDEVRTLRTRLASPALREGDARQAAILQTALDAIVSMDQSGRVVEFNPAAERIFGHRRADVLGRPLAELIIPPALRAAHHRGLAHFLATGIGPVLNRRIEITALRADGTEFPVELAITPFEESGSWTFIAYIRDVTERKRAEQALRAGEAKYRAIFDNAVEGFFQSTAAGVFLDLNPALARIYGYASPREVIDHIADIGNQLFVDAKRRREFLHLLDTQGVVTGFESQIYRKDGSRAWVSECARAVRDAADTLQYYEGTVEDITERKRAEEALRTSEARLRQSQKMEAVGQLAGGIAHDFNNLLTVILGYCEILLDGIDSAESRRDILTAIKQSGLRAAALTNQLLAFSRRQVLEPRVLSLNAVVADLEQLLRRLIGVDIALEFHLEPRLDSIKADPGQLEQVILNLVVNARDAMPRGGKIVVATSNFLPDAEYATAHPDVGPGRQVLLAVSDTGSGMTDEVKSRIFEPFFTTKEIGKGTGLGLATVYGIVEQSGGHIDVRSELGRGTEFKIYLPRVEKLGPARLSDPVLVAVPRGQETVLLVEDEAQVRALSRRVLEGLGYHVLEASDGAEAIRVSDERRSGPIHLLISDVVMPHVGGRELAERLADARPEMKVLFMSGYTDDAVVRHGVREAETAFLQKPFTPSSLARKVRDMLDKHGPNGGPRRSELFGKTNQ